MFNFLQFCDAGVVILTDPPFLGPLDYFDSCEWDPFFINGNFFANNFFKSLFDMYMQINLTYLKNKINFI